MVLIKQKREADDPWARLEWIDPPLAVRRPGRSGQRGEEPGDVARALWTDEATVWQTGWFSERGGGCKIQCTVRVLGTLEGKSG